MAKVIYTFEDQSLHTFIGQLDETSQASNTYVAKSKSQLYPFGSTPTVRQDGNLAFVVEDIEIHTGYTGGNITPLLVEVIGPKDLILERKGSFISTTQDFEVVSALVDGTERYFFGGSPSTVFAAVVDKDENAPPNFTELTGFSEAALKAFKQVRGKMANVSITTKLFNNPEFTDPYDWNKDVKLTDAPNPTNAANDNKIFIEVLVKGLEVAEADRADLKLPVVVYRTVAIDPSDSGHYLDGLFKEHGYTGAIGALGGAYPELSMLKKKVVQLDFDANTANGARFRNSDPVLIDGDLKPNQGDGDGAREFAILDNSPSPNGRAVGHAYKGGMNGNDGYTHATRLKHFSGYISRGLAHPLREPFAFDAETKVAKNDPFKVTTWNKGGPVWGRPVGNAEFVAAAGVEKIVVSAALYKTKVAADSGDPSFVEPPHLHSARGSEWLFPGLSTWRNHLLVASPADFVYLGGHCFDRNRNTGLSSGGWYQYEGPTVQVKPGNFPNSQTSVNLKDHWKLVDGKQEVEWLVLIACWGLERHPENDDTGPYIKWANDAASLKLRGILGFQSRGWSGRREVRAFLNLEDREFTSGANISADKKAITLTTDKTVNLAPGGYEKRPARHFFMPTFNLKVEHAGAPLTIPVPNATFSPTLTDGYDVSTGIMKFSSAQALIVPPIEKVTSSDTKNMVGAWLLTWGAAARGETDGGEVTSGFGKGPVGSAVITFVPETAWGDERMAVFPDDDPQPDSDAAYLAVGALSASGSKNSELTNSQFDKVWFLLRKTLNHANGYKEQ